MIDTKPRRYNGAVRTLADLHGRCVEDQETGCWHLRDGNGRPMKRHHNKVPTIYVHAEQRKLSARRVAWLLGRGEIPAGKFVAMTCGTWDCVNPKHLAVMTAAEIGALVVSDGRSKTARKRANCVHQARNRARTRFTMELAQWVRESSQKQIDIAHAMDTTQQRISDIKRGLIWRSDTGIRGNSVFSWAGAQG